MQGGRGEKSDETEEIRTGWRQRTKRNKERERCAGRRVKDKHEKQIRERMGVKREGMRRELTSDGKKEEERAGRIKEEEALIDTQRINGRREDGDR